MYQEAELPVVRRVVNGLGTNGRSRVIEDASAKTILSTPGFTDVDVWSISAVPTAFGTDDALDGTLRLEPPFGGLKCRIAFFPPDQDWRSEPVRYDDSLKAAGYNAPSNLDNDGMHATSTIDIAVVTSGEIYSVTESDETLLKAGDCLIRLGTRHAWSNRSDRPCVVSFTMVSARADSNSEAC